MSSNKVSYVNVTRNVEYEKNTVNNEDNNTKKNLINKGWTILKKGMENPQTQTIEKENKITMKEWDKFCLKECERWNKFRDEQNDLLGDLSPYFNYKEEIDKMVKEDEYIAEQIYEYNNGLLSDNDSEYNSDDEGSRHLF